MYSGKKIVSIDVSDDNLIFSTEYLVNILELLPVIRYYRLKCYNAFLLQLSNPILLTTLYGKLIPTSKSWRDILSESFLTSYFTIIVEAMTDGCIV